MQLPPKLQWLPPVQWLHICPSWPQFMSLMPIWQFPIPSQHPPLQSPFWEQRIEQVPWSWHALYIGQSLFEVHAQKPARQAFDAQSPSLAPHGVPTGQLEVQMHAPPLHESPASQTEHATPTVPHAGAVVPGWHLFIPSQQPLQRLPPPQVLSQVPLGLLHAVPGAHIAALVQGVLPSPPSPPCPLSPPAPSVPASGGWEESAVPESFAALSTAGPESPPNTGTSDPVSTVASRGAVASWQVVHWPTSWLRPQAIWVDPRPNAIATRRALPAPRNERERTPQEYHA